MKIQVEYLEVDEMEVLIKGSIQDAQVPVVVQTLQGLDSATQIASEITGMLDDAKYILAIEDIHFFESDGDYLYAETKGTRYRIKQRLREVEKIVEAASFIRISKWCVANIKKIEKVEAGFNATMTIFFKETGKQQTLTRSYIKAFKERVLGE